MVAAVRWHGFKIDIPGIKKLLSKARSTDRTPPRSTATSHRRCVAYIGECMDDMEKILSGRKHQKANLMAVAKWAITEEEDVLKM